MNHFVTLLITLRVILCPLFCELQGCSPSQVVPDACHEVSSGEVTHKCCSRCSSEPSTPDDFPEHSCPDCDCFCTQSLITGMKVDLEQLTASTVWEVFLPDQDQRQASLNHPLVASKASHRAPGIFPGRSMRLVYASLLI